MARIRLLRHATLLVSVGEVTVLVDPMLGPPESFPPIQNTPNRRENPLVALPEVELSYDAVLVTHRHRDHFDDAARESLDRDVPLLCQPEDADAFREEEFTDVRPVADETTLGAVTVTRTPARHGRGELAEQMAPVSGFVLDGDRTVYLAGDTVWYDAVAETIDRHDPDAVVVNAGAAQFLEGDPITMDEADVRAVRERADCPVVAVHADAINHCLLSRADLREAVDGVVVPDDGDAVTV